MERATQRDELGYYLVGDAIYGDCGPPCRLREHGDGAGGL